MSDASERFLDLATKPLAGNHDLRVHARWELGEKLKAGSDEELEEASRRLETRDPSKWTPGWVCLGLILFGIGLLGLSVWKWVPQRHIAAFMLGFNRYSSFSKELSKSQDELENRYRSKDPLLFEDPFDKSKNSDPADPVYFATYFQSEFDQQLRYTGRIPMYLLDRVSKIDPHNGWWSYTAASSISKSLELSRDPVSGLAMSWQPESQGTVDLALQLFHEAATAPRFESYQTAIKSRKIDLSPPVSTVSDCFSQHIYVSNFWKGESENLSLIRDILPIQARNLARQKDIQAFKILLADWIKISKNQAEDFNDIDDLNVRIFHYQIALNSLLQASQDLQLDEEARIIRKSLETLAKPGGAIPINKANQQAYWLHGTKLTFVASPSRDACGLRGPDYFYGRYPTLTSERLKPNRRAEHAFVAQLLILPVGVLLLAASAILFLFRFRNGRLCREVSASMVGLFDRSDWICCVGFGVILPTLYFAVIRYLTPFGGMDWFATPTRAQTWLSSPTWMDWLVGDNDHLLERARFLLLFLLIVSCSFLVLRQRLRTRMSFFETSARKGWIGVGLTIAGFIALPLLGSCFKVEQDRYVRLNLTLLYPSLAVIGTMLIWLVTVAFCFLFGSPEQALRRQTLSRLMAHMMILAFALVCGTIPLHMAEERFWVKRDTVLRTDPAHPAKTRYEWEVIQQMKGELLEALAPLESLKR